jgi:polysaccharide deacetylase 2 family uncharacterized protein YibQ
LPANHLLHLFFILVLPLFLPLYSLAADQNGMSAAPERVLRTERLRKAFEKLQREQLQRRFAEGSLLGKNPSNMALSTYVAHILTRNNFPSELIQENSDPEEGLFLHLKLPSWINLRFLNRKIQATELGQFEYFSKQSADENTELLGIHLIVQEKLCEIFFEKTHPKAKIAIIIDDVGYFGNGFPLYLQINRPMTFSVLPLYESSGKISSVVDKHGFEVMLHLPLDSGNTPYYEYEYLIRPGQTKEEVSHNFRKSLEKFPVGIIAGVNNHEGSASTEDQELMDFLMQEMAAHPQLYFVDSITSPRSVAAKTAEKYKIPVNKRHFDFLDNVKSKAQIKAKIQELIEFSLRRSQPTIAILHEKKVSAQAVIEMLTEFELHEIEIISPSEIINNKEALIGLKH